MAVADYIITPKDAFRAVRWFGLRGAISLVAAMVLGFVLRWQLGIEAGIFAGLFVFWAGAGYSGRLFFAAAILLLVAIMGISIYDAEYEVGDTKATEQLAVWVFYFMAIGVMQLFIETIFERKKPNQQATHPQSSQYKKLQEQKISNPSNLRSGRNSHTKTSALTPRANSSPVSVNKQTQPIEKSYSPTKQRRRVKPNGLIQG